MPHGYGFEPHCSYGEVCIRKNTYFDRNQIIAAIDFVKSEMSKPEKYKYTYSIQQLGVSHTGLYVVEVMIGGGHDTYIIEKEHDDTWSIITLKRGLH